MSEDFPALAGFGAGSLLAGFGAGSLLAGYRLEAQIGAGGMAVVFRARDERLGRLVALKILAPALTADSAFRRRFIAESRAAAAVDDPHIIPVHEAGEADGVLFIAMRFVVGGDLRRVLEREGALAPGRAAEFISPVASALDAAHARRTGAPRRQAGEHPGRCGPDRPDHVYLSDFGVSKGAVSSVSLTRAGQFLGTPDYSAPEQIEGRAVDGRTDQYALACVAYELLTGAVPFKRDRAWRCCWRTCPSRPRRWARGVRACPPLRIRCWPGGWRRSRRSGTGPAGTSPTRCGRRSAWRRTIPAAPPPRPIPPTPDCLTVARVPRTGRGLTGRGYSPPGHGDRPLTGKLSGRSDRRETRRWPRPSRRR